MTRRRELPQRASTMTRRAALVLVAAVAAMPHLMTAQAQPASRIVRIVGDAHKLLLRADGTVAGWGRCNVGQLGPLAGISSTARGSSTSLVAIDLPAKAVDIAAGTSASYALLDDGSVMAWGAANSGQLGNGKVQAPRLASSTSSMEYRGIETPARIAGLTDVASIAAAGESAYAVLRDGTVRAWGGAAIGDGRAPREYSGPQSTAGPAYRPVTVPGLADIVAVSAGGGIVLALTKDGRVFSWGSNFYGALGRPPRVELSLDTPGEIPGLRDVAQVVAGAGIATALENDGSVWVWGSNWQQQFGFPAPTDQPSPTTGWMLVPQQVPGVANVTSIAGVAAVFAAGNHSLAVRRDGTLWAWGAGGSGEFPLTTNVRVPTAAPPGLQ